MALALVVLFIYFPVLGADLKYHWASSGLIAFAGCLAAFRLPRAWRLPGLLAWFIGIGTITLLAIWSGGLSDGFTFAGVIPSSDAAGYFADAQRILAGEAISSFSSRRPLYSAFLAAILKVTGNNLRLALWIQVLLISSAIGLLTWRYLQRTEHKVSAAFLGMALWLFYHRFVGTTTTESLGFLLGILGFLALWEAANDRSIRFFYLGVFITAWGLNARAGAFFILPVLLIWGGRYFANHSRRQSWTIIALGASAIGLAFALNYGTVQLCGGRPDLVFSNFSYTLYGLVGGGNWQLALTQHPELKILEPGPQAQAVMQLVLTKIQSHPSLLLAGAFRAWRSFLPHAYDFANAPHPWAPSSMAGTLLTLVAGRGAFLAWRTRRSPSIQLLLAYLIGILVSVPFVPSWDSDYMRVYAATIPVFCWLVAMGALPSMAVETHDTTQPAPSLFTKLVITCSFLVLAYLLPHLGQRNAGQEMIHLIPGTSLEVHSGVEPSVDLSSPGKSFWSSLLRERKWPSISTEQLEGHAHPKFAPMEVRSFLESLPRGNFLIAMGTSRTNPGTSESHTSLLIIQDGKVKEAELYPGGSVNSVPLPPSSLWRHDAALPIH